MIVLGCFFPLGCLSAGARGGNPSVQWEQEPPEAAGRAASEGRRLAAGGQPALAQPLPAHRSQVRSRRAQVVKETILRCALQLSGVLLTSPPPPLSGQMESPAALRSCPPTPAPPPPLLGCPGLPPYVSASTLCHTGIQLGGAGSVLMHYSHRNNHWSFREPLGLCRVFDGS